MKALEEQLSEVIAESDRVAAELHRELLLIGRAHAAIGYLRSVREESARRVEVLLEQRSQGIIAPPSRVEPSVSQGPAVTGPQQQVAGQPGLPPRPDAFGTYDPHLPR